MMVAVLLFLIQSVSSLIIRSNIDRIDNITCSDELPIAASIFGQGDLKCLAPHDIYKNSEFRDVNIIEWIEFRYHHFEKYIYTDLQWKKEDFYSYRFNDFIEVRPMIGCLRMLKHYSHAYIFRTFGKDPRNPTKCMTGTTTSSTKKRPSTPASISGTLTSSSTLRTSLSPSSAKISTRPTTQIPTTEVTGVPTTRPTKVPTTAQITGAPTTRFTKVPTTTQITEVTTGRFSISSNAPTKFSTNATWISATTSTGAISRMTEAPTPAKTLIEIIVPSCLAVIILSIVTVYYVIRQNGRRLRVVGHIYGDNIELDNMIETESTV